MTVSAGSVHAEGVEVRVLRSEALARAQREVLGALWVAAFGESFTAEDAEHAWGGHHVIAFEDGAIVAHAAVVDRVLWVDGVGHDVGYVEAVASRPDRQRRGLGRLVMGEVGRIVDEHYAFGALSASEVDFYLTLGWRLWRGPTGVLRDGAVAPTPDDDGGVMVLLTARSPALDLDRPLVCEDRPGDCW